MKLPSLMQSFRAMQNQNVYTDPLLVQTCIPPELQGVRELASQLAGELSDQFEHEQLRSYRDIIESLPYSSTIMRVAIEDTLLSTAVVIVHDELGISVPRVTDVVRAYQYASTWIHDVGLSSLYIIYLMIAGHDITQPLMYQRTVSESEFVGGMIHHPYNTARLDVLLLAGLAHGTFRLKTQGGERMVQLTRVGATRFGFTQQFLQDAGYIQRRVEMSHLYQFGDVKNVYKWPTSWWPGADKVREEFVDWLHLSEHARVLEVEHGRGRLAFDGGLFKAVSGGQLVVVDGFRRATEQGRSAHAENGSPSWVSFEQASLEHLPFPSGWFDAVVGCGCLQAKPPIESLGEMCRVVRSGGIVGVLQGIRFSIHQPFFKDWLEPLLDLARRHNVESLQNDLPTRDDLLRWFDMVELADIHCHEGAVPWVFENPAVDVLQLFRGVSWFQTQFLEIPWTHRRSLIEELIDRGKDVCRKYGIADRTVHVPALFIRGRVV